MVAPDRLDAEVVVDAAVGEVDRPYEAVAVPAYAPSCSASTPSRTRIARNGPGTHEDAATARASVQAGEGAKNPAEREPIRPAESKTHCSRKRMSVAQMTNRGRGGSSSNPPGAGPAA